MADVLELPGQRRREWLDNYVLMMLEANRLERRPHAGRVADAGPHLADLDRFGVGDGLLGLGGAATGMPDERSRHARPPCPSLSTCSQAKRCRCRARAR